MKKRTLCQQKFDRTKFGTETDNLVYSCSVSVSVLSQKFQICPVSVSVPRGGTETGQDRTETETGQIMVGQENTAVPLPFADCPPPAYITGFDEINI